MKKHGALWKTVLVSLGTCLLTAACGDDKSDSSCIEGTGRECTCPDGTESIAACGSDGEWEECDCDGDDGTGGRTARVCLAGELDSCFGPGNCEGVRECNSDGTGYGDCTCPPTGGTGGGGTGGGGTGGVGTGGGGTGGGGTGGGGTGGVGTGGVGTGGGGTGGVSGAGAGGTAGAAGGAAGMAGSAGVIVAGSAGTSGFGGVAGVSGTAGSAGSVSAGGVTGTGGVAQVGGSSGQGGAAGAGSGGVSPVGGGAGIAGTAGVVGMAGSAGVGGSGGDPGVGGLAGTAGVAFWSGPYTGEVPTADWTGADHNEGDACESCHNDGLGTEQDLVFGGTVYVENGNTGVSGIQIGVRVGGQLYTAYSTEGGNFWVIGTPIVDWSDAEVRIRNANGELIMGEPTTGVLSGDCNSADCHTGSQGRLEEPPS